jgi:hypothetical protein
MVDFFKRDSVLKKRWCYFRVLHAYAKMDLEDFKKCFPNHHSHSHLHPRLYYFILMLIGLGEIPLNMVAFRLFGEAEVMSLAVALALALVVPASAHWVGAVLKQPYRTRVDKVMLIMTLVFVVLAILSIGLVREAYLRYVGGEVDRTVTFTFICIQLAMFSVGILASYATHDLHNNLIRREWELRTIKGAINGERKALRRNIKEYFGFVNAFISGRLQTYLQYASHHGDTGTQGGNLHGDVIVPVPRDLDMDRDIPVPQVSDCQEFKEFKEFNRLRDLLAEPEEDAPDAEQGEGNHEPSGEKEG